MKNYCSRNENHLHDNHYHHHHHHHDHRVSVWRTAAATAPPGDSPPRRLASTLQTPGRCDHWLGTWRASSTRLVVPWYFQTWYLQPWIYQLVIRSGQGHLRGTPGWWLFSTGGIIINQGKSIILYYTSFSTHFCSNQNFNQFPLHQLLYSRVWCDS